MSPDQRDHFKQILHAWKQDLMEEVDRTVNHLKEDAANFADPNDRASQEEEYSVRGAEIHAVSEGVLVTGVNHPCLRFGQN